jgi:biopolymer transport protein ExbB/TolQ
LAETGVPGVALKEVLLDIPSLVSFGTLFVVIATLVVAVLALRSARQAGEIADNHAKQQLEEQEHFEIIRGLRQGLDWERQERQSLHEALEQARQELLEAQQRAEHAEQNAMREATRQLRARMDDYLKELGDQDTWPSGIRRVK